MKYHIYAFVILTLLGLANTNVSANNIRITNRHESTRIINDSTFVTQVSIKLKSSPQPVVYPVLYDHVLEKVSEVRVYRIQNSQHIRMRNIQASEETINLDYINCRRVKSVVIPANTEVIVTYTITCNQLMYLADLRFFSYFETDSLRYDLTIHQQYRLTYRINNENMMSYLAIDSLNVGSAHRLTVKVVPAKVESDPMMYFGIYRNLTVPIMRTIVVPETHFNNEQGYFNQWLVERYEPTKGLSDTAIKKIDEITQGISDTTVIVKTLYDYVRTRFKNVSIQVGMGAFIPTPASEVFRLKYGDCKDLLNFLCEALNYKGIRSDLALAATFNHISDCDFPVLGSANHVICVMYINGSPLLLDPTDPIHLPGLPVESLQNRTVFIINSHGGEFLRHHALPAPENRIGYYISLVMNPDLMQLDGAFDARYNGIAGNFLKRTFLDLNDDKVRGHGKKHFESIFNNQQVKGIAIADHPGYIEASGELSVKGRMISDNENLFLFFDFLPRLIESVERNTVIDGTFLRNTISKTVNVSIDVERPFESFHPIQNTFSADGISVALSVTNPRVTL